MLFYKRYKIRSYEVGGVFSLVEHAVGAQQPLIETAEFESGLRLSGVGLDFRVSRPMF
jgi:hypothetical protein